MREAALVSVLSVCALFGCGGGGAAGVSSGPMPDDGTFSGVYHSPQYGDMNFIQNGSAVVGEYKSEMRKGKIQGEAEGDLLRFEWTEHKAMVSNRPQETRGHGYFKYMIDKGNGDHVLKGEWGLGDDETGGGQWNAYKLKNKEPHLSSEDRSSGGESEEDDSESSDSSDDQSKDDDLF
jgi:hypothetical protein